MEGRRLPMPGRGASTLSCSLTREVIKGGKQSVLPCISKYMGVKLSCIQRPFKQSFQALYASISIMGKPMWGKIEGRGSKHGAL